MGGYDSDLFVKPKQDRTEGEGHVVRSFCTTCEGGAKIVPFEFWEILQGVIEQVPMGLFTTHHMFEHQLQTGRSLTVMVRKGPDHTVLWQS